MVPRQKTPTLYLKGKELEHKFTRKCNRLHIYTLQAPTESETLAFSEGSSP